MVYTALSGNLFNLDRISEQYLEGQNTADYWLTGTSLDAGDCRTLEELPGVTGVQPRIVLDAEERYDSDITLQLYAVPEDYVINTPYVVAGTLRTADGKSRSATSWPRPGASRWGTGTSSPSTGTGRQLRLYICGLIKDPECMYLVNATNPAPDLSRYAFAYGTEELLSDFMGANRYNQICVTTDGSVSSAQFRAAVDDALGDRVINVLALEDNTVASYLMEMRDNLAPILSIFPVLFFLCAVLMMVSTMNRLIENARPDIGTFKALGYSDSTILFYYLLHAILVVAVGFPIGAWSGRYVCASLSIPWPWGATCLPTRWATTMPPGDRPWASPPCAASAAPGWWPARC